MKQSVEIRHQNNLSDSISSMTDTCVESASIGRNATGLISSSSVQSKSYLSLESLIKDNPNLTGPEIITLYKSETESQNLKHKNYLLNKLAELSENKQQTFILRNHGDRNIAVKVKEYYIENDYLYVKATTIDNSYNNITFKDNQVFDYNYFSENIISNLEIHTYFSMENTYNDLLNKLKRLQ